MKLLLINSFLHPRGGDTTLFFAEWEGWTARKVTVLPFAMRHPDNLTSPWAVRFPSWRSPRAVADPLARAGALVHATWNREAAAALDTLCRDTRPQAAHVHHLHRHLTPAIFPVLRKHRVRTVWTLHDHELVCPNGLRYTEGAPCFRCAGGHYHHAVAHRCKDGDRVASVGVAVEKAVHRALREIAAPDVYVSPSEFLAAGLREDGVPGAIEVVPNLVTLEAEPGPPGANVVYAGRLAPEKGTAEVAALARALPEVAVHVYGEGPGRPELSGIPNVTCFGARPRAELHRAFATAGVVIVPSRWPENQPYAVVEAQGLARPVVAAAVGGIPELIHDGVDGRLVPPGDTEALVAAVGALLADRPARLAMGARARERVLGAHDAEAWFARMGLLLGVR